MKGAPVNIETKVGASTTAAGLAAVLTVILAAVGVELPAGLVAAAATLLVAVVGYLAPHTNRPDLGEHSPGRHAADDT